MKLSTRFEQALILAAQLHAAQTRKSRDVPYISHLLSVTALVLEDGGDEDEAIAALLHDAVEDQGGIVTRNLIRQQFGETVVGIVDDCTESVTKPKPPWRDRKLKYLDQMRRASPSALKVSLADKLHNARCVLADYYLQGNAIWDKFKGGKDGTLWFYRSLLEVYKTTNSDSVLVQELEQIVVKLSYLCYSSPRPLQGYKIETVDGRE